MDSKISREEALIIVKGSIKMAQQDHKVVEQEVRLLQQIIQAAGIYPQEVGDFNAPVDEDISSLAAQLKSKLSKQAFLLCLATMALADGHIDDEEKKYFKELAKSLQVGTINLEGMSYETAEAKVLKIMKLPPLQDKQVLDVDLM